MTKLADINIVLASASPRRKELLQQIGVQPVVIVGSYSEQANGDDVLALVESNTRGKLEEALETKSLSDSVVIAADTIVVLENEVFGKPKSQVEAFAMLCKLSGKMHKVITGVAIYYSSEIMYDYSVTNVYMRVIKAEEITAYIAGGEPYDKAGGYGIQAKGALFVDKIDGCYSNVVGLPLPLVCRMLADFHLNIL